jgi:hypothetical protein
MVSAALMNSGIYPEGWKPIFDMGMAFNLSDQIP